MSDDDGIQAWAPIEVVEGLLKRAEQAEATIQRVRRRAEGPTPAVQGDWMAGYASAMRDVLRALEGDKR